MSQVIVQLGFSAPRRVCVQAEKLRERFFELGAVLMATVRGEVFEDLDDRELVELVCRGGSAGPRAYEEIVRRHQAWMLRMVSNLMRTDRSDAEDVVQEIFVGAYLGLDTWRGGASLRSWLRTIAVRTTFNWQRSRKTAQRYEAQAMLDWKMTGGDEVLSGAEGVMAREVLEDILDRLAYPYREVLILRYLEEMSIEEISDALSIGKSAAKMRLKRARDQFKAAYGEIYGAAGR